MEASANCIASPRALPRVGVLALQGDVREHVRSIGEAGATPVLVVKKEDVPDLDAIILPGGESTAMAILLDYDEELLKVSTKRQCVEGG